jgi:hypothetical protein
MKRDMDLVRRILLAIEAAPTDRPIRSEDLDLSDVSREVLGEHAVMLDKAGLIEATFSHDIAKASPRAWVARRITWNGYEYLESVRNEGVWTETKSTILAKGGTLTFEIVKAVATGIVKQHMGLKP